MTPYYLALQPGFQIDETAGVKKNPLIRLPLECNLQPPIKHKNIKNVFLEGLGGLVASGGLVIWCGKVLVW